MDLKMDAQMGVIGSMLLGTPEIVAQIVKQLKPEDFIDPTLRTVYSAARELYLNRKPVDPVMLVESLGTAYNDTILQIINLVPSAANWQHYAAQVKDNRQLMDIQAAVIGIVSSGVTLKEARELLGKASKLLLSSDTVREATYAEIMAEFVERQLDPTPPDYLDLGLAPLNKRVRIGPRRFVVLGAESSVGKTAFALQLARSIAVSGKRVGFFSYETAKEDLGDRVAANVLGVPLSAAKDKLAPPDALKRAEAESEKDSLPLKVIETAKWTIDDIRVKILTEGFDVVFVDYLQLIPVPQKERWQAVTQISMDLHALAQETGAIIFGLSQVTPPQPDKKGWRPWINKHNLRESQQLNQDADLILLLDLCDVKDRSSDRVLIIDKNKDGGLGSLVLQFSPDFMRFTPVTPAEDHPYNRVMAYIRGVNKERQAEKRAQEEPQQVSFREYVEDDGDLPF